MKKYRGTIILSVFLSVVIVSLAVVPVLRYNLLRSVTELPGIFAWFNVSYRIYNARDFEGANRYISYQLDLSEYLTSGRSQMLSGVVSNLTYIMDEVRFPEEYAAVLPSLLRLTKIDQNMFLGHLWLAKTYLATGQSEMALSSADKAIQLIPSDPRPYRIALNATFKAGSGRKLSELCQRYRNAQLGGSLEKKHRGLFSGRNLGQFGFEYVNENSHAELAVVQGIVLGKYKDYKVSVPVPQSFTEWRFHFPFQPGTKVTVDGVTVNSTTETTRFTASDINIFPDGGFILGEGQIFSQSPNGMIVSIIPSNANMDMQALNLSIRLKIDKAGVAWVKGCQ